jgi:ABC-type phosphate transport system substrate-binding protein
VLLNRVVGSGTRANMAKYLFDGEDSRFAPSAAEGENAEVAQAVRETSGAISYLGLAYLTSTGMRVFAIDQVQANRATIQSGAWPITAQGYVITKGTASPSAQTFLTFLTSSSFQHSDAFV